MPEKKARTCINRYINSILVVLLVHNKRIILSASLLVCSFAPNTAQDSIISKPNHLFGIYSGYSSHVIKDEIVSPLIYKGIHMPVELNYLYLGKRSIQKFSLLYNKLDLKSSISNGYYAQHTTNINGLLTYSYNRKIVTWKDINTELFLGGKLISEINYRDHFYNEYNDAINGDFLTSLGINIIFLKKFRKDNLDFNLNMQLIGYSVINNRYNINVGISTATFITLNKWTEFQTNLSYIKFINKHIGLEIKHQFQFYSIAQYSDLFHIRYMNNQILGGLIIRL